MSQVTGKQIAREFSFGCPYFEGRVEEYGKEIGTLIMNCGMNHCGIDVITERQGDSDDFEAIENTGLCVALQVVPFDLASRQPQPEHPII